MEATVYIDVLFVVNLIINYLLLLSTARLAGVPYSRLRLAAGAMLGAAFSVLLFFISVGPLTASVLKIVCCVSIIFTAFGLKKRFLQLVLLFCAVTFIFGGGVYALYLLAGNAGLGQFPVRNGVLYVNISLRVLLLSSAAVYFLLTLVSGRLFHRPHAGQRTAHIRCRLAGREAAFDALEDTGFNLTDPVSNNPVIVADYSSVFPALPPAARQILRTAAPDDPASALTALSGVGQERLFRLIPYKTIGGSGMMLAFRPDTLLLDGRKLKNGLVAISPTGIADGTGAGAVFSAALH